MSNFKWKGIAILAITILNCFSCDMPLSGPLPAQNETKQDSLSDDNNDKAPEKLLQQYFEALKTRDHKTLQGLLLYANKFFTQEPQPIIQWELQRIEELSADDADAFNIRPNPIQGDLLLYVKVFSIDEYKKQTWEQRYFLRKNTNKWGFVNRIGADTCSGIFLKYGEDAFDFTEYKVLQHRAGQYLVEIFPHLVIAIDDKTRELGRIVAKRGTKLTFIAPDALYCDDKLMATWLPSGKLEAKITDEKEETQDSLKTE